MIRERISRHSSAYVPFMPPLITALHPTSNIFALFAGRCGIHCPDPECPSSVSELFVASGSSSLLGLVSLLSRRSLPSLGLGQ